MTLNPLRFLTLLVFVVSLGFSGALYAFLPNLSELAAKNINIRLQEPEYHNGVITTTKGGIVEGEGLYLQAKNITYVQKEEENFIDASGDLLFRWKKQTYTGSRVIYDVNTQTSVIYDGRTQTKHWFVGGKRIELNADGSGVIHDASFTTTENVEDEWSIRARTVRLDTEGQLKAKNVRFLIEEVPVFWVPRLTRDLNEPISSQLKYRFQYQFNKGAIAGVVFKFLETSTWKSQLLLDIGFDKFFCPKGVGGGLEARYVNPNKIERLNALAYFARDIRIANEDVAGQTRYMFQAKYQNAFFDKTVDCKATFDKQSDQNVSRDYIKRNITSSRVGKTQATFSKRTPDWISLLNARVKVNTFQTVKQQLPLFTFNTRPMKLGSTGFILDNRFNAGYLDYQYRSKMKKWSGVHDFHSTRLDLSQQTYRNFLLGFFSLTPQIGYRVIGYGNSPQHTTKLLALGNAGVECHSRFVRQFSQWNHAVEPYVHYQYLTSPTVNPRKHYIFDMQDGWYRLNMLRFGLRNFFTKEENSLLRNRLSFDVYGYAFFDTPTITRTIPRVYLDGTWKATPWMKYSLQSAWYLEKNIVDHCNLRGDFTLSEDIALALEYRHRSAFAWRKVDAENFIIDSFLSEKTLRHSPLSNRRDTLLGHLFCRLTPDVSLELLARHGWNQQVIDLLPHHKWRQRDERHYTEYEARLTTLLQGTLRVTLTVRHLVGQGVQFGFDISLGGNPPSMSTKISRIGHTNYE